MGIKRSDVKMQQYVRNVLEYTESKPVQKNTNNAALAGDHIWHPTPSAKNG